MKFLPSTGLSLCLFFFCSPVFSQNPNPALYAKALAEFSLTDRYAGCDNADSGRWFLHFQQDGSLKFGFWGTQETPPTYRFDDESQKPIPLGDVFQKGSKWKRIDATTLEISNRDVKHRFTLAPNYETGDPLKSTRFISLSEVDGKKREFVLEFNPQYEKKFKASSVFR